MSKKIFKKKILLGLTTTPGSDWRKKIEEIDELGLKEIALFPTFLDTRDRKELYKLLETTNIISIPHVHLRDDMKERELDYLVKRYKAKVFNIHPNKSGLKILKYKKYVNQIFLETLEEINDIFIDNLEKCGGICLDISHCEDCGVIQNNYGYDKLHGLLKKYKVGCCHISAVTNKATKYRDYLTGKEFYNYSRHHFFKLSEFNYVKKYVKFLPKYVSIELENSFEDQLKVKNYLEKIINKS